MKLAEALQERADLNTKINELRCRLPYCQPEPACNNIVPHIYSDNLFFKFILNNTNRLPAVFRPLPEDSFQIRSD